MTERMIKANDIDIWTESFGDPAGDPLLLIMGATAQGIYWPQELIHLSSTQAGLWCATTIATPANPPVSTLPRILTR